MAPVRTLCFNSVRLCGGNLIVVAAYEGKIMTHSREGVLINHVRLAVTIGELNTGK